MADRERDMRDLDIMHRAQSAGESYAAIGKRYKLTRAAIGGIIKRIRDASDDVPCRCRKPENRDGGMPPRWWAE